MRVAPPLARKPVGLAAKAQTLARKEKSLATE